MRKESCWNKFLRKEFQESIRSGTILKATLLKNIFTVLAMMTSVVWLVFWGMDLFFANSSLPYVKTATVIIGYGAPITNIYFDQKRLQRRVGFHRFLRASRQQYKDT